MVGACRARRPLPAGRGVSRRGQRARGGRVQSLEVLSNRADLISGGDALVAARLVAGAGDPRGRRRHRRHQRVRAAPERALRRARHRPEGRRERADRARRRRGRQADHDHQPPDRRPDLRRPAGHALRLQPERVEPAARRGHRRAVQRADAGRATSIATRRNQFVAYDPANPPAAALDPADDDRPRADRAVHRPARDRAPPTAASTRWPCSWTRASRSSRGRPSSRGAASSSTRSAARAGPSTASSRPSSVLQATAARRRLRGRHLEPEHLRQQLQRRGLAPRRR